MPRTETCNLCGGEGVLTGLIGSPTCPECGGNGYLPMTAEERIALAGSLRDENGEVAPLIEPTFDPVSGEPVTLESVQAYIEEARRVNEVNDLTDTKPVPGRMANQTWRILEEQRQAAEDTIRECDAEIERWANKQSDAIKTKRMCEAGQAALDGGL